MGDLHRAAPYEHFPAVGIRGQEERQAPALEGNRREAILSRVVDSNFFQNKIVDSRFMVVRAAGLTAAMVGIVIANTNNINEWNS